MRIKYSAKDINGKNNRGFIEAPSLKIASGMLREQKLIPIQISEVRKGSGINMNLKFGTGVSSSDLTNFTRQMATMINAGLPLTDALNLLKVQSGTGMTGVINGVLADVQSGVSLSAAMAKYPKVFSRVYIALVKAGEAAGLMEKILNRLADTAEKGREFKGKVVGAMIYPIIILIGMVAVFVMMIVLVIPKLTALYKDFNADLPIATRVLVAISDFTVKYWPIVILMVVGAVFGIKSFLGTEYGRNAWSRIIYKLPVMGPLMKHATLAEFSRTMALLLSAGVSVVEALRISADSVGNVIMIKDIKRIANQVEKGFPVSISFSESESFPQIFGQMAAVGEETGKMDDVLSKLSYYFESESEEKIKGLTTAIEPIILVVMAVGVGFLMYAIVMPIYGITNKV